MVWGCMAAGVALAVAFAIVELRRTHPLLDIRLFGRPDFATGAVGITFLFFANFGFFFVAMQYMQLILGYSPLGTAFALVPLAVPILILGATLHLYLPKIGLRTAVALGLFLIAVGLFCMRVLDAESSYLEFVWPILIVSAGIGLCVAPTTSAIMGAVPDEKQGVASAVNDTTREVGAAIGIAVAGSVVAGPLQQCARAQRSQASPSRFEVRLWNPWPRRSRSPGRWARGPPSCATRGERLPAVDAFVPADPVRDHRCRSDFRRHLVAGPRRTAVPLRTTADVATVALRR